MSVITDPEFCDEVDAEMEWLAIMEWCAGPG